MYQSWKTWWPEAVASVCEKIIRADDVTDRQLETIAQRLDEALAHPRSVWLPIHLASLRELQQRYDEAERLYRRSLELDPRCVAGLNNLAFLLSLQGRTPSDSLQLIERAITIAGTARAARHESDDPVGDG